MSLLSGIQVDDEIIQQHILRSPNNPIKPIEIIDRNLDPLRRGKQDASSIFYKTVDEVVEFVKEHENNEFTSQDYENFNQIARSTLENDFKINFDEEVQLARQGMSRLIAQLNIPEDLKKVLQISIDSTLFDTDSNVITMQPNGSDFHKSINLSPSVILAEANILSRSTKQELSAQMIRTLIIQSVAHELGHVIDHTLGYKRGFEKSSASRNQINQIKWEYPINYTDQDGELNQLKEIIIGERFAGFFAKELVSGLNGNNAFLNDAGRIKIGFGHVKQLRLEDLTFTLYAALSQVEDGTKGSKVLIHTMIDMIICNNSLAEIFSFTKEDIEKILTEEYITVKSDQAK